MGKTHWAAGALFTAAGAPVLARTFGVSMSPEELGTAVFLGTVAGVLPDIDHPQSMITKGLIPFARKLKLVGFVLGWWLSIPPRLIGHFVRGVMGHRGGTHSLLFLGLWTVLAAPIYAAWTAFLIWFAADILNTVSSLALKPLTGHSIGYNPAFAIDWLIHNTPTAMPMVMIAVGLGYLSHLVADSLTIQPVPWPWPFKVGGQGGRWWLVPRLLRTRTDSPRENMIIRPVICAAVAVLLLFEVAIPIVEQARTDVKQVQHQITKTHPKKHP